MVSVYKFALSHYDDTIPGFLRRPHKIDNSFNRHLDMSGRNTTQIQHGFNKNTT